ncbi:MAG: hypothetical protein HKN36_05710 [Hellea sp.]|nr:hypothetical protein [Hellea sp.]
MWLVLFSSPAIAADSQFSRHKLRKDETYKVELDALSHIDEPTLDWRNPAFDIPFEIPTSDWVEEIEVFLKVHAEGPTNRDEPIYIRFNQADPVAVFPRGSSFEARLSLDTSYVKSHRNVISVSYGDLHRCVMPSDGAFSLDLSESLIVLEASTPSRPYYLRDLKQILASPLTAPKTVTLKTHGPKKLRYEALTAQGIALNIPSLPRFNLGSGPRDMEIHVGTRAELASILKGTAISRSDGPVIGITQNAPIRMVLTADNHDQLEKIVTAFATSEMPPSRRSFAHSGEFSWQPSFYVNNQPVHGKTPIYKLGNMRFDRGWGNNAQTISFDVDNPLAAEGTAKFHFQKGPYVSKDSTVSVALNGNDLGTVELKRKRNLAKFDLPRGMLKGTDNLLTVMPVLSPNDRGSNCSARTDLPGFAIEAKSYLNIKDDRSGFQGDLTRFAASGFPFANDDGQGTIIVFATDNLKDRAAALRAFAKLGEAYGSGWINAEFVFASDLPATPNKQILFIGPQTGKSAPKDLTAAIEGRIAPPKTVQVASLDGYGTFLMSVRAGEPVRGGIAALYPPQGNETMMTGYITSARGRSFTRAVDTLVKRKNWNQLEGSLARWDKNGVAMSKTAFNYNTDNRVDDADQIAEETDKPGLTLPNLGSPSVDLAPVGDRLKISGKRTANVYENVWKQTTGKARSLFKKEATNDMQGAAQIVDIEPINAGQPTKVAAASQATLSRLKPAPKLDNGFDGYRAKQYEPGATLRSYGLRGSQGPSTIQTAQKRSLIGAVSSAYTGSTNWLSNVMDQYVGGPFAQDNPNRRANFVIIALVMVLLLILIGLARPKLRRD